MKKLIFVITAIALSMSCTEKGGINNSLNSMNLKGKVKIISEILFGAYEEIDGTIVKGGKSDLKVISLDEKGNIIEETNYKSDGSIRHKRVYNYDEKSNLVESIYEDENEKYSYKTIYKIDVKGNIIEEKRIYKDGGVSCYSYVYDEKRNMIEGKSYSEDGSLYNTRQKEYDENRNMIKEKIIYENDSSISYYNYIYDEKRNMIEEKIMTDDGKAVISTNRYQYKFDNEENWVWRLESDGDGEPKYIIERKIEYY